MRRVLCLAALAGLAASCGDPGPAPSPVRPVITVTVTPGAGTTPDVYSGEVRARTETDLAFRIGGKLLARPADAGQSVKRGQVLARLDPDDAKLAAQAGAAQLASAEADLGLARAELERATDLLGRKFISASAHDARVAAHAAARARVDQARSQAQLTGNQAAYATLAADADGVVVSTAAEPGQVVAAGQPILRLARAGALEVVVNVPEASVARLRAGQPVAVSLWADPSAPLAGRVREIAGSADAVTRTFAVRVTVENPPPAMRLGMTATVGAGGGTDARLIVVPLAAVVRDGEKASVWVVDPATSRTRRRPVQVGQYREDGAVIAEGLAAGDIVVAAGVHKLREDEVVRAPGLAPPAAPAPPATRP